ncbi:zinc-binding metallopeptidase family protein [Baekduia alba]|uniref:zinc-binding metallopeptidase family protein n=1 Tax=Baekduia alba TaxID=2997333 RepID=UPI00233FDEC9|nr:putative zinc-binding metallopeptidase [Baekduia alba]
MRSFTCGVCGQLVFFDNTVCLRCGSSLGFDWDARELRAGADVPWCANRAAIGCNGLAPSFGSFCAACALTRVRPADDDPVALAEWVDAERAKRRLVYELGELKLPIPAWFDRPGGLGFDLLSSTRDAVTTGHADGIVTLDLAESDDARREQRRIDMGEPYRTLLGHFRHEVGHFYFPLLVDDDATRAAARALFGDETEDYQAALDRHYRDGPPDDWAAEHVSAYATMHPSEDWAETFAHVLHLHDTLQTAASYGLRVEGPAGRPDLHAEPIDPEAGGLRAELSDWLGLTYALNAINRSLGFDDLYPFVLTGPVVDKLAFVDGVIARGATVRSV